MWPYVIFCFCLAAMLAVLLRLYQKSRRTDTNLHKELANLRLAQQNLQDFALTQLVRGNAPRFELLDDYYQVYNLSFPSDAFMLLLIKLRRHPYGEGPTALSDAYTMVQEELMGLLGLYAQLCFVELDGLLICFYSEPRTTLTPEAQQPDENQRRLHRLLTQHCEACAASLLENHAIDVLIAVGRYDMGGFGLHSNYLYAKSLLEQAMRAKWSGNVVSSADALAQKTDNTFINTQRQFYNCFICFKYEAAASHLFHMVELRIRDYYDSFAEAKEVVANQLRFCTDMLELPLNVRLPLPDGGEISIRDVVQDSADLETLRQRLNAYFSGLARLSGSSAGQTAPSMERIYNYIQEHYTDALLSVSSISDRFHLNVSYLSRQFKQEYDCGVLECIHKTRIAKAKELLAEGAAPNDCFARVGYTSRRAFDSAFSRYEGITPKAYHLQLSAGAAKE